MTSPKQYPPPSPSSEGRWDKPAILMLHRDSFEVSLGQAGTFVFSDLGGNRKKKMAQLMVKIIATRKYRLFHNFV